MNKKSLLHSFLYGNKAILLCIVFTISTMLDLTLCVYQGIADISYWHLGMRFILCALIVLSLYVFKFFENLPTYAILIIHFGLGLLIMLGSVWITSLYSEIHPHAYRDAARTIIMIYPIIILGCLVMDGIRTAKANRILKKRLNGTQ